MHPNILKSDEVNKIRKTLSDYFYEMGLTRYAANTLQATHMFQLRTMYKVMLSYLEGPLSPSCILSEERKVEIKSNIDTLRGFFVQKKSF